MRTYTKLLATAFAGALALTIAPTFALAETCDGGDACDHVAAIGEEHYDTLNDAVDAVEKGDTITLIADVPDATGISVPGGSEFTIDFDDHTYTLTGPGAGSTNTETNAFQLLKGSTITFKDGTVNVAPNANNIKRLVQNYANVTFENMTFDATNQVDGTDLALSFNCGNVTFKGDTNIVVGKDATAFDVYYWKGAYEDGVSVTFDDSYTGSVDGVVLYDSVDPEKAALTIKGNGTFGGVEKSATTTNGATVAISGGTFTTKPADEFLAEGFVPFEDEDGNFTAVSEDKVHTVTIEGSEPVEVLDGATVAKPADPTARAGYTFAGWTVDGKAYDFATPVTSDLKIEQSWTLNAPKVTITPSAETLAKGETVTLTAKAESEAAVTFTFEWINGAADKAGSAATATSTATGSMQVNAAGTYSVKVTATDADGLTATATASIDVASAVENATMYRLYNQYTGEHLYTGSETERDFLDEIGWTLEGVAWTAPGSGDPVYRLFNPYADDHHFTMKADERDALVKLGWIDEGVAWYSADKDDEGATPLLRLFNPYEERATHLYTADEKEYDALETLGWIKEGIAWYGLNVTDDDATDEPTTDVDEPAADDEQTTTDTEKPAEDEKPAEEQPETDADAK